MDREERTKFYKNKHQYIIEQIYYSNPRFSSNLNSQNYIELINPCKYFVFMAQVKYFLNYNVNELFNYNLYFFDTTKLINPTVFFNKPVIKNSYYSFNSSPSIENNEMTFYNVLNPFYYFPMANVKSGFGISSFALYPNNLQPSGTCNMSSFNTFEINTTIYPIDIDYNNYIFKCYSVTYNYLKITNGVAAPIFNSNF